MNQADKIEQVIIALHEYEQEYVAACKEIAEAEGAYRHERSLKYLQADGTIADRNAEADVKAWDAHKRKLAAEATLAIMKARMENCRNVLSARQSILSAQAKTGFAMDLHAMKQI
jgi:hypothetical protein